MIGSNKRVLASEILSAETSKLIRCPPRKRIKKIDIYDHFDSCIELYDVLRAVKDSDGTVVSDTFLRTPSRRVDSEYYKIVERPIDFSRILQKIKSGEYKSFKEFCADIELLFHNAKLFYKDNTTEYNHLQMLLSVYNSEKERLTPGCSSASGINYKRTSPSPSSHSKSSGMRTPTPNCVLDEWRMEAAIVSILQLTDSEKQLICPPFRLLDPPEEFPDYYEKIKNPIDLKTICKRIRSSYYASWSSLEADIRLMCKNAKIFNSAGSKMFQDADVLLDHFILKMQQLMDCRKLNSRDINAQHIDNLIRSSDSEANEYSEDSEEDEDSEHDPDPKWILYWKIRNFNVVNGVPSCESFLELPSKRSYPDYYEEVENPMSLFMINKKLKRGEYVEFKKLVDDVLIMLDNAYSYNMEDSPIYRSAQKLRNLTLEIAKEHLSKNDRDITDFQSELNSTNDPTEDAHSKPSSSKMDESLDLSKQQSPSCSLSKDSELHVDKDEDVATNKKDDIDPSLIEVEVKQKPKRIRRPPGAPPGKKGRPPKNRALEIHSVNVSTEPLQDIPSTMNSRTSYVKDRQKMKSLELNLQQRGKPGRKSLEDLREACTTKLLAVWTTIRELKIGDRQISEPFLFLPCDKTYPDYYSTIKNPIDLTTIRNKIRQNKYPSSEHLISDFSLMFANARIYNRPDSQIIIDSNILESVAISTLNSITGNTVLHMPGPGIKRDKGAANDVIKRNRGDNRRRKSTNDLSSACSDEISVDKTDLEELEHLDSSDDIMPIEISKLFEKSEKRMEIIYAHREQKQMQTIFEELMRYRDDDGRLQCEWFIKLPTEEDDFYEEYYETIKKPIDLAKVASKLNSNQYESWRQLISDLKLVFENACKFNDPESEIYKDALNMLKELIHLKYEFFDDNDIQSVQNQVRQILHQLLDYLMSKNSDGVRIFDSMQNHNSSNHDEYLLALKSIQLNLLQGRYRRLDRFQEDLFSVFSRIRQKTETDSQQFLDTVELQKNYLSKRDELCKGILVSPALLYVASQLEEEIELERREKKKRVVEDKFAMGIEHDNEISTSLDKTSVNLGPDKPTCSTSEISDIVMRPLSPIDIPREEVSLQKQPLDGDLVDTPSFNARIIYYQQIEHNGRFYRLGDGVLVYRPEKHYCDVVRIDKLWKTGSGERMFAGCCFARPHECHHELSRMFYRREVFGVKQIDLVEKIDHIQGKCAILTLKHAETCRPTEIPECDVFVVDQKVLGHPSFDNQKKRIPLTYKNCSLITRYGDSSQIDDFDCSQEMDLNNTKPLRKLKHYHLSHNVAEDEMFYFKTPLIMDKVLSPLIVKSEAALPVARHELEAEEQRFNTADGVEDSKFLPVTPTPSVEGATSATPPATPSSYMGLPNGDAVVANGMPPKDASWLANQPKLSSKSKSGYILFSAEVRKRVMNEHPEAGFGEVSRLVGIEWKKLSDEHKHQFETRAQIIADERTKAQLLTPSSKPLQPGQIRVYCCKWQDCDFQFDSLEGLVKHVQSGHTELEPEFICLWQSCLKYRREGKGPFLSRPRLHRHIREKHAPSAAKIINHDQKSKTFFVYVPPPPTLSKQEAEKGGLFIHQPYGRSNPNAVPNALATLNTELKSPQQNNSSPKFNKPKNSKSNTEIPVSLPPSSSALSQTMVQRIPTSTPISTVLNGIHSSSSTAGAPTTHYIVQHPQNIQSKHQTVIPTTGNAAPVQQFVANIGGTTVYLPAGQQYQTVILNPGIASTSGAGSQQIILHPQASNMPPTAYLQQQHHHQQHQSQATSQQVGPHFYIQPHHQQQQHTQNSLGAQIQVNGVISTSSAAHMSSASGSTVAASGLPQIAPMPPQSTSSIVAQHQQFHAQSMQQPSTSAHHPHNLIHLGANQQASSNVMQQNLVQTQQATTFDAGRTLVTAPPRNLEPVFVASASNPVQIRRVLHSEAYVKYIESMYKYKQRTVSKWDKSLASTHRNTTAFQKKLPYGWIKGITNGIKPHEEECARALWKLRDQMLEDDVGIERANNRTSDPNGSSTHQQS